MTPNSLPLLNGRWKKGYNPDIIFVSYSLKQQAIKRVERHIPRSQHRLISCEITHKIRANTTQFRRRFNFQKANWLDYSNTLDTKISHLTATSDRYDTFVDIVKRISRKFIPGGCRTRYIPGLTSELSEQFQSYSDRYENYPFNLDTIKEGERLLGNITEVRRTN